MKVFIFQGAVPNTQIPKLFQDIVQKLHGHVHDRKLYLYAKCQNLSSLYGEDPLGRDGGERVESTPLPG